MDGGASTATRGTSNLSASPVTVATPAPAPEPKAVKPEPTTVASIGGRSGKAGAGIGVDLAALVTEVTAAAEEAVAAHVVATTTAFSARAEAADAMLPLVLPQVADDDTSAALLALPAAEIGGGGSVAVGNSNVPLPTAGSGSGLNDVGGVGTWLLAGCEADGGVEEAAGGSSSAAAEVEAAMLGLPAPGGEARWHRRAATAYAGRFSRDELALLVRGVARAAARDAAVAATGIVPAAAWLAMLHSLPFNPARSAADLRDRYEELRTVEAGMWRSLWTAAWAGEGGSEPLPDLPMHVASLQERAGEEARALERSRAGWDHDDALRAAELLASSLPGRAIPLGVDAHGAAVYMFGPAPTELWVEAPVRASVTIAPGVRLPSSVDDLGTSGGGSGSGARLACPWSVVSTPAAVDDLLASLNPVAASEGHLSRAIHRHAPLLRLCMTTARDEDQLSASAGAAAAAGGEAGLLPSCALCGASVVSHSGTFHCFICHDTFATDAGSEPGDGAAGAGIAPVSAALVRYHVAACWEHAAARPHLRAAAVVCSAVVLGGATASQVAVAEGWRQLLGVKQALGRTVELVNWSRLHHPAVWPLHARAEWGRQLLVAAVPAEVARAAHMILKVCLADDLAATAVPSPARSSRAGVAADGAHRWLPIGFADACPSEAAVAGINTVAGAAALVRQVALALQPHLLVPVALAM